MNGKKAKMIRKLAKGGPVGYENKEYTKKVIVPGIGPLVFRTTGRTLHPDSKRANMQTLKRSYKYALRTGNAPHEGGSLTSNLVEINND